MFLFLQVVASATNVIAELLLDEDKLPVAFDKFFQVISRL